MASVLVNVPAASWEDLRAARPDPTATPFLKWAGGKGQVLTSLKPFFPSMHPGTTYFEPFLGGGAVFFALRPRRAVLADKNRALTLTFQAVKDDLELLLAELRTMPGPQDDGEYYDRRREFNRLILRKGRPSRSIRVKIASLFVWLNHTCYNGLYRVNRGGEFNVPKGSYRRPSIYSEQNLRRASKTLRWADARIECADYAKVLAKAQ